jgi:phospholipid/cholesterol/gamma-HCH transport system permease protein
VGRKCFTGWSRAAQPLRHPGSGPFPGLCSLPEFVPGGKTARELDAPAQTRISPTAAFEPLDARHGVLRLGGDWTAASRGQSVTSLPASFPSGGEVCFDLQAVTDWDSALLAWLFAFVTNSQARKVNCDLTSLPAGIRKTLELALAVPERTDARPPGPPAGWVTRVGLSVSHGWVATRNIAEFIGEAVLAAGRLIRGRAQFRRADFILFLQEAGAEALPINLLISFLVGLILAFVGAVQLQQFGASVYVANLVAIAMVREMGCLMSGIIMCGRTGAAYAAQLGTMKVNQEIDAYRTFRFNPVEFLVLPRMLALFLMMPLLTVFANLAGITGGLLIGVGMLDLTLLEYWSQTVNALTFKHCAAGLMKSFVFGLIVAITGCYNGMRCPNNAAGVGQAATTAVVAGITAIVVADALFAVLFNIFKF